MTNLKISFNTVPVAILCGGDGVLLDVEPGKRVNKGLIQVEGKPLFFWVMQHYAMHGATDFVLATGIQSEQFSVALIAEGATLAGQPDTYALTIANRPCTVRRVITDTKATTAARLLACKPWLLAACCFALTYCDTLSNVDLSAELAFHSEKGVVATLVGATYPVRFRILGIRQDESLVRAFAPRPIIESTYINGGYYIFDQAIWGEQYGVSADAPLENNPLERLAAAGQLVAFQHKGDWQHYDGERDLASLGRLAHSQQAKSHVSVSFAS